jgi:hypothetical protein
VPVTGKTHIQIKSVIDFVPHSFSNAIHGVAMWRKDDFPFPVELWDDNDSHIEEVLALASDYATAKSAYEQAIKRRPGRIVTLRQKTRVLADSRRKR